MASNVPLKESTRALNDIEWRLQELEKAVAALCKAALNDGRGDVESLLQRERALSVFRDHASLLQHRDQILIGEVVQEDT